MSKLNGDNQTNNDNKSVVSKILEKLPEVDEAEETKKPEEQETSTEETNVDEGKDTSEEEAAGEEAIVIKPNENVVVTEEIAEAFGLEEGYIGKTVTFSEEEIAEANEQGSEESVSERLLTEAEVKELGLPKNFVGKPFKDAGKSYKETVKWQNKNNQEIKNLEKKLETVLDKISDKDLKNIEDEAGTEAIADVIKDVPDSVTEPEKFAKWLLETIQTVSQKQSGLIVEKIMEKVGDIPSIKTAEDVALQNMENETMKALQAGLPEGVKAAEVFEEWFNDNQEDYEAMVQTGLYKNNPNKLIKDILIWHKASNYDSLKSTKDKTIKKEVHKKTVENLRAKGDKTKTNFGSNPRQKIQKNTTVSKILKNLEAKEAAKQGTP